MIFRHIPRLAAVTVITASLFLSSVSAAESAVKFSTGNRKVITDLILLKSMMTGETASDTEADLNSDGTVNSGDAVILADYLLGKSELPEKAPVTPPSSDPGEKATTSVTASEDICIRGDGTVDEEEGIINVAGFNAAKRRNVYIKFKADELNLKNVNKAEIELRLDRTANGNTEVKIAACGSGWSESAPPEYKSVPDSYGLCDVVVTKHNTDAGKTIKFDVTDVVRENPEAKEFNFVLWCDHENNSDAVSNLALFNSRESQNPPKLTVYSGPSEISDAPALKADGTFVRFEIPAKAGSFLRVSKGALTSSRNVSPLSDARFTEVTGFKGENTVSFESQSEKGSYLCRKNGGSEIILAKDDGSEEFKNNASFIKTKGLAKGTSYQAYGLPGRYLSCTGNSFYVTGADTDERKSNASFLMRSHSNVIMSDEFEGDSLDTNVWAYSYPWADHHNYSAVVRKSQVAVRDGKLVLTATRVADDNWIKDDKGETGYTDNIGEKKWRKYSHLTGVVHLPFKNYPLNGNLYMEGRF
ncbi:MAG: AbfB domain-containing protein, partial [Oscillospiraceae bacterium]|nr:AbfB domain-containing protein [Oscillospiraceae bacterium]